jgi:predicted regulator of Ras-like GTPase activity (Roadblock/LC7/MglB family)
MSQYWHRYPPFFHPVQPRNANRQSSGSSGLDPLVATVFPYDEAERYPVVDDGPANVVLTDKSVRAKYTYAPESVIAKGRGANQSVWLSEGSPVIRQLGRGNQSNIATTTTKIAEQAGKQNQNTLDVLEAYTSLIQRGRENINKATVKGGTGEETILMEGAYNNNEINSFGGAKLLTMAGEHTHNTVEQVDGRSELVLQTGTHNQHVLNSMGAIEQLVMAASHSVSQNRLYGNVEQALVEGDNNKINLYATEALNELAIKGNANDVQMLVNNMGKLGIGGVGNKGRIHNIAETNALQQAWINGENGQWQLEATGTNSVLIGGENNQINLVLSHLNAKKGLTEHDEVLVAGKGNQVLVDAGVGNDTVMFDPSGGGRLTVDGGSGDNTLVLAGEGWRKQVLEGGVVRYTNANGHEVVEAKNMQTVRYIEKGEAVKRAQAVDEQPSIIGEAIQKSDNAAESQPSITGEAVKESDGPSEPKSSIAGDVIEKSKPLPELQEEESVHEDDETHEEEEEERKAIEGEAGHY